MARKRKKRRAAVPQLNLAIQNARAALDDLERAAAVATGSALARGSYDEGFRDGTAVERERGRRALSAAQDDLALQAQRIRQLQAQQGHQPNDSYQRGYQTGFAAGRAAAPQQSATPANEQAIRSKMREEMLERCRVIAESNPQMAAGVNAVRHMIKKL